MAESSRKNSNAGSQDPFITVQFPESEVYDNPPDYDQVTDPTVSRSEKKGSWLKRHLSPSSKEPKTIAVRMRKSEFLKYFVKDQKTGGYKQGVVEPPGGRMAWLQERIQEFRSGELDENAYERANYNDYEGLNGHKRGPVRKAAGDTLDWIGTPDLPWAGKPVTWKESDG